VQSVADSNRFTFPQAKSDPRTNCRQFRENEGVKKSLPFTYSVEFNRRPWKNVQTVSEIGLARDKPAFQTKDRQTERADSSNYWKFRTTDERAHMFRASTDLGKR
jgi:hypothetical protein